jgi:hypothetical protein
LISRIILYLARSTEHKAPRCSFFYMIIVIINVPTTNLFAVYRLSAPAACRFRARLSQNFW